LKKLRTLDASGSQIADVKKETLFISKSIGSRYDITEYWIEVDEIKCGCYKGNLKDFENRVKEKYPEKESKYRKEYLEFITECKTKKNDTADKPITE
jgi:hypothetical protein